jgi:hypothetical protein
MQRYQGGAVDVLVTSNTAAATAMIGPALRRCPRPPVLVVMHTAPGVVHEAHAHLMTVEPHITARFDINHERAWLEMEAAPGKRLSRRMKDVVNAINRLPEALRAMYPAPTGTIAPPPTAPYTPPPVLPHPSGPIPGVSASPLMPRAGPQPYWPPPSGPPQAIHRGSQGG